MIDYDDLKKKWNEIDHSNNDAVLDYYKMIYEQELPKAFKIDPSLQSWKDFMYESGIVDIVHKIEVEVPFNAGDKIRSRIGNRFDRGTYTGKGSGTNEHQMLSVDKTYCTSRSWYFAANYIPEDYVDYPSEQEIEQYIKDRREESVNSFCSFVKNGHLDDSLNEWKNRKNLPEQMLKAIQDRIEVLGGENA